MKKVTRMLFLVGIMGGFMHMVGNEVPEALFGKKIFTRRYGANPYKPATRATIILKKGDPIPEGYEVNPVFTAQYRSEHPGNEEDVRLVEKKIFSGSNEYYNQFIEGYEPKEESEIRMRLNRPVYTQKELDEDKKWMDELHSNPEYKAKNDREKAYLLEVEKKSAGLPSKKIQAIYSNRTPKQKIWMRTAKEQQEGPKEEEFFMGKSMTGGYDDKEQQSRLLYSPKEQGLFARFSNWLASFFSSNRKNTSSTVVEINRQNISSVDTFKNGAVEQTRE